MLHVALLFFHFVSAPVPVDTSNELLKDKPRKHLIHIAKSLIGSPYCYSGCSPKGFDCSGFTQYVYRDALDIQLKRSSSAQAECGKKVKPKAAIPGDLIFFEKNGKIDHVAMIVENRKGKFIVVHSTSSRGVILEDLNTSDYWKSRKSFIKRIL